MEYKHPFFKYLTPRGNNWAYELYREALGNGVPIPPLNKMQQSVFDKLKADDKKTKRMSHRMTYNLYLDDVRMPGDSFHYTKDADYIRLPWHIVRSHDEFVTFIYTRGLPEVISFDHDLVLTHQSYLEHPIPYEKSQVKTGYHCALWLVEYCTENVVPLPEYKCHSFNPAGKDNILSVLNAYQKHST